MAKLKSKTNKVDSSAILPLIYMSGIKNALSEIDSAIDHVNSASSADSQFCKGLLTDLMRCKFILSNTDTFKEYQNEICGFATMYYQQRSNGLCAKKNKHNKNNNQP